MAGSPSILSIKIVSDASDSTRDFQAVSAGAVDMGNTVEQVSKQIDTSARRMDGAADAADNMAGEAGKATGALGALSSGFELVGLEQYAVGLQGAAMATDFFSGVGDALNLVMNSQAVIWIKNTAASVAHRVATAAGAVVTGVMTAAQWALNAAMSASPIFLIVAGVALLVGAIVLAYKKSETFRRIVTGAFDAIQGAASAVVGWIKSNWPLLLAIITGPIGLAVLAVVKHWDTIKAAVVGVKDRIAEAFRNAGALVRTVFESMAEVARNVGDALLAPFRAVKDMIDSVIDAISNIDLGVVGDLLGKGGDLLGSVFGRQAPGGVVTSSSLTATPSTVINLTVEGAIDPMSVGRQIVDLLTDYLRATGQTTLVVGP